LHAHRITLRNVNWLGDEPIPVGGMSVAVRVRSTSPPQPGTVYASGDGAKVLLGDGEYGIAAGQACVLYGDTGARARVLGGGWIARALTGAEASDPGAEDADRDAEVAAEAAG
jgi:tRNA-specific 2-thiouridylase